MESTMILCGKEPGANMLLVLFMGGIQLAINQINVHSSTRVRLMNKREATKVVDSRNVLSLGNWW